MPYIQVEAAKVSQKQKEELIEKITNAASEVLNVEPEHFYVLIKENSTDNWGVGGKTLTNLHNKK